MSQIPVQSGDPVIMRLQSLAMGNPVLKDAARIYEALLPIIRDCGLTAGPVSLTSEEVKKKIEGGYYILSGLEIDIDRASLRNLAIELAAAVESVSSENSSVKAGAAHQIRLALEENRLDISSFMPFFKEGDTVQLHQAVKGTEFDLDLLAVILQYSVKPVLRSLCSRYSPAADGLVWVKGHCFVCGAFAAIAELQGDDQSMHLRCTSCGGDWEFKRLKCMHCENEDHKTQSYFSPESNGELIRVELCDNCMGYLKVFNSFKPDSLEMLIVKDMETVYLDYVAKELGYTRHL